MFAILSTIAIASSTCQANVDLYDRATSPLSNPYRQVGQVRVSVNGYSLHGGTESYGDITVIVHGAGVLTLVVDGEGNFVHGCAKKRRIAEALLAMMITD